MDRAILEPFLKTIDKRLRERDNHIMARRTFEVNS